MGDVMTGLFGGNPFKGPMTTPPLGGGDVFGPMATPPIVSPTDNPQAAIPGVEGEPIGVEGWAPTKRNIIGRLADAWLQAQGQKPVYEPRMKERDYKRAIKGFSTNPEESIRRMMQVDPELGYKMYEQHTMNETRRQAAQDLADIRKEKFAGTMSSMLGAANERTYPKMLPYLQQYATDHDLPPPPDVYDPDIVNMWRMRGISTDAQIDNKRSEEQFDRRENRMASQFATSQANTNARFEETQDRIDARADKTEAGRNARFKAKGGASAQPKTYKDSNGSEVTFSPDRKRMVVKTPDGKEVFYKIENGKKVRVN